jgi:hypothetical protein
MFFNPNTLFFLNPIPRSPRESPMTEGNSTPVLDSTTAEDELSARESEPQSGENAWLENTRQFSAFWRNGCFGSRETAATAAADAAADAATKAAEDTRREVEVELELGSFGD